ncbi:AAA family ATPase [Streptomyces sp. NPDC058700]|uniref:AAA family ATPase n=1 Tax=Streptomyces sp. NPDC058700 TaxID=3346607 RepID=UPI0036506362
MYFTTIRKAAPIPGMAFLGDDNWDDYGFRTLFDLRCHNGRHAVDVGGLKIGYFGMEGGRTPLPQDFGALDPAFFFSLGADEGFYARLRDDFDDETREEILRSLCDVAYNPELFERALSEPVMEHSLLRGTDAETVRTQYRRIAHGGPTLSRFHVRYEQQMPSESAPRLALDLMADPYKNPPTNIHAVIGSNGVGKTRLLHSIAQTTLTPRTMGPQSTLEDRGDRPRAQPFNNVMYVSFSAFDSHGPHQVSNGRHRVAYQYVGLKRVDGGAKDYATLASEFAKCVERCVEDSPAKASRWADVLGQLEETDPLFGDLRITELAQAHDRPNPEQVFGGLSSGHKIVLLTLAQLVQHTTERTLVLIDEPEGHLHPPLLSTFVRTLSALMKDRNGLAVIATHSPVVLQETPSKAVWALRRVGADLRVDNPEIETFGENVGTITREIFALEVRRTGFNWLIQSLADDGMSFEGIIDEFGGQLGAEGRALARSATHRRERGR